MDSNKQNQDIESRLKDRFADQFKAEPLLVRAPGRINLIGEHTDYNEGFVFPAAVEQCIQFAIGPSQDPSKCTLVSLDFETSYEFDLHEMTPLTEGGWQNYILGVVYEISKLGKTLKGFNLVFSGSLPIGAGMSSSAALECGTAVGLTALFDLQLTKWEIVKLSQRAEHNYVGVMCGIMDQFASTMGKADKALLLDCRSLDYEEVEVRMPGYSLLLCNSNVSHSLASSEYNVRRQQCEEGVRKLQGRWESIHSLRDVSIGQLEEVKDTLDPVVYRRCKYVIEENERVKAFKDLVQEKDVNKAGQLLFETHRGLSEEYEVSCPELDFLVEYARSSDAVAGARMMGGGFGGCTLNLIKEGFEKEFIEALQTEYQQRFDKTLTYYPVELSDGVTIL